MLLEVVGNELVGSREIWFHCLPDPLGVEGGADVFDASIAPPGLDPRLDETHCFEVGHDFPD